MKVRRVLSNVRWAFQETIEESQYDIDNGNYKKLCNHCAVRDGPNCPRKKQLQSYHTEMTAIICIFFSPKYS